MNTSQEPMTSVREEIVEVPSEEPGKKRLVKRIIKQISRINPVTGEREVVSEQTREEPYEELTKEISTVEEEIIEAPYFEQNNKKFMKRTIKYIFKVNPITGEKEIVGKQQMDKPISQTQEQIPITKEEIVEVPDESGKSIFVRRVIRYLYVIDPATGNKKVVSRKSSDEPLEELKGLNDVTLSSFSSERIVGDETYDEGKSLIGRLQKLAKQDKTVSGTIDDTIEEDSYNGKELIDRIKSALVFEDVESKEVSDMDIHIDPSASYSLSEDPSKENKKYLIYKNYKEYEDFVDNNDKKLEKVTEEPTESVTYKNQYEATSYNLTEQNKTMNDENIIVENHIVEQDIPTIQKDDKQYLKRKSDQFNTLHTVNTLTTITDVEKTDVVDDIEIKHSKKPIKTKKSYENTTCCGVKSSYFDKCEGKKDTKTEKETENVKDYRRVTKDNNKTTTTENKQTKQEEEECIIM